MLLKPWRRGGKPYLIPDTHEPGVQKGFGESQKGKSQPSHTPGGRGRRSSVKFWPVGKWAGGAVK